MEFQVEKIILHIFIQLHSNGRFYKFHKFLLIRKIKNTPFYKEILYIIAYFYIIHIKSILVVIS